MSGPDRARGSDAGDDDRQLAMLRALIEGGTLPGAPGETRLVETHISRVVLSGPLALKFKRPLSLPFVDYSDLQRRQHYCEREIELNRRLSPEIYRRTTCVTGTPQAPRLGGDGPVLEHAVEMRRFPDEALAGAAVARGEVEPRHVRALGERLARFHAQAPRAPADGDHGDSEHLHDELLDCIRGVHELEVAGLDRGRLALLHAFSARSLVDHGEDFRRRRRAGFVRECHGDLHLGNLVLLEDRLLPFDCIEFNDYFRIIDVTSEIAFLSMDLTRAGRPGLAAHFVDAYLAASGDYEGLRVLRHYQVYRALVRAKVAGIRLQQTPPGSRGALEDEILDYLGTAVDLATAPDAATLVVMHGLSGSGKSRLAEGIVARIGAVRVRSDVERKRLYRGESDPARLYGPAATRRTYDRLLRLAETILRCGYPVVLDATYLRRRERERCADLASDIGVRMVIVETHAPPEVLEQRVAERASAGADPSDADPEVVRAQHHGLEPLDERERARAVRVDTTRATDWPRVLGLLVPPARPPASHRLEGRAAREDS